jgi:pimeloyl-ACP methyl ester carboxylesterase
VRFADYNSAYNAKDLNAVREALGYDEWNLYGVSYGTHWALTIMRDLPEGVRSVVLDSVIPPEINNLSEHWYTRYWAIEQIAANCAADTDCSSNIGDLKVLIEDGIERLNDDPVAIPGEGDFTFTGLEYITILAELMTQPELATWISTIATGTDEEIVTVLQAVMQRFPRPNVQALAKAPVEHYPFLTVVTDAVLRAVTCSEEKPYLDMTAGPNIAANFRDTIQRTVDKIGQTVINRDLLCDIYIVPARDVIETQPVLSNIPTLVLAGTNDSRTPPAWSKLTADTLGNSQYAEFEGFGHSLLGQHQCINDITLNFLNFPGAKADQTCISSMPKVNYITE